MLPIVLIVLAFLLAILALCGVQPRERLTAAAVVLVCVALLVPKI